MFVSKFALASLVSGLMAVFASGAVCAVSVDLTSLKGVTIGGGFGGTGAGAKFAPWGGSMTLSQANSNVASGGFCAFDITFDLANLGDSANTVPFGTWLIAERVVATTINGVPWNSGKPYFADRLNAYVATSPTNLAVNAGQSKNITTQAYLPAGTFTLQLSIDPNNVVSESKENNNLLPAVTVTIPDLCGGVAVTNPEPKPTPTPEPTPTPKPETKMDIASTKGVTFGGAIGGAGGKFVAWGGTVALTDADAFLQSNGSCAFNVAYDMENLGDGAITTPFKNTLTANGKTVAINSALTMTAGQTRVIATQPYLPVGRFEFKIKLDSDNVVAESNEGNNVVGIKATLSGTCGAKPPVPVAKADLASQKGVVIAGKSVAWGGSVTLRSADMLLMSNGKCAVNLGYDMANIGTAAAGAFANRLYSGSVVISQQTNQSVEAGKSKIVNTQAYLTPRTNVLSLVLDADNNISESNESNNKTSVTVNVDSTCTSTVKN